eukprot:3941476-Rhodomonas_salina.3
MLSATATSLKHPKRAYRDMAVEVGAETINGARRVSKQLGRTRLRRSNARVPARAGSMHC